MRSVVFIFICMSVILCSCKTVRTTQKNTYPETPSGIDWSGLVQDSTIFLQTLTEEIKNREISFTSFSGKADISYTDTAGKKTNANAFFRIQKDSIIWVSIRATLLNIEGLRMLITPDSVKILDKMQNVYLPRPIWFFEEITGLPFTFYDLQNLIMGNMVPQGYDFKQYTMNASDVVLFNKQDYFSQEMHIDTSALQIEKNILHVNNNQSSLQAVLDYAGYEKDTNGVFSKKREILINDSGKKTQLNIHFRSYSFNELLSFPFTVPNNYKVD